MAKILFLHGWHSVPGGLKPTFLKDAGYTVWNPSLDDGDLDAAVRTAQAEYDQHQLDVDVGSSRGGVVALKFDSKDTPLVLLYPAWKRWGGGHEAQTELGGLRLVIKNGHEGPWDESEQLTG